MVCLWNFDASIGSRSPSLVRHSAGHSHDGENLNSGTTCLINLSQDSETLAGTTRAEVCSSHQTNHTMPPEIYQHQPPQQGVRWSSWGYHSSTQQCHQP